MASLLKTCIKQEMHIILSELSITKLTSLDFKPPCTYYIRDAMDYFVFIKTRNRKVAQELINAEYGRGKYM